MAKNILQLNYDELSTIAKVFKDEGEDVFNLHSATRQRVRDLYKEWVGEAAEKFFDEMENELLPALQRLSKALHFSQDVVCDIMKIVHEADEDTMNFFKGDLSGEDFGAGAFQGALGNMPGGQTGSDDFGAGKFGEAVSGFSSGDLPGGGSSGSDDFGAGKFKETLPSQGGGASEGGQTGAENPGKSDKNVKGEMTETQPTAGGGGGGSSSSQGFKGDLKNLGVGMGQVQQNAFAGNSGGGNVMTDHVYSGGGFSESGNGDSQTSPGGANTNSGEQSSQDGGGAVAAAGAAGAVAAGGAAKGVKSKKRKNNR